MQVSKGSEKKRKKNRKEEKEKWIMVKYNKKKEEYDVWEGKKARQNC